MKTVFIAASIFAASLFLPENAHALKFKVDGRVFTSTVDPETGPKSGCPKGAGDCVVTVTFSGWDVEVTIGSEMAVPGTPIDPNPVNGTTEQEVMDEIVTRLENEEFFPDL